MTISSNVQYLKALRMTQDYFWKHPEERTDSLSADMFRLQQEIRDYEQQQGHRQRVGEWGLNQDDSLYWLDDPRPEDVSLETVAWRLSRMPRYLGGTLGEPYSVAQHCLDGSYLIDPEFALEFLLHDAEEAYLGDWVTPVKRRFAREYECLELPWKRAVRQRFGLRNSLEVCRAVEVCDARMLATEIRQLTGRCLLSRELLTERPYLVELTPLPWREVYGRFLARYQELSRENG